MHILVAHYLFFWQSGSCGSRNPPTVLIRFPKRLPCADNVRSINGFGLIERDLVGSATTVFTPESKEFKHREPTANFDFFCGKRWDPYTPSQTRFSIALECNSSKVEATVSQIRLLYMHFFWDVGFVYVKYVWEWLDKEICNLRKRFGLFDRESWKTKYYESWS